MNMNFRAAIFDMDGTLIDSLGIWARVDELFFQARGMEIPEDYSRTIVGMGFRQCAEYTKERFGLAETCDEIIAEWSRTTDEEYALRIPMKPGAQQYLRALKRAGIKLAVATALPERLYAPCLKRHGLYELFDALCSTDDVDGRGKAGGEVFKLAAKRLGVRASDCVAFDDAYDGVLGANRAGMRAICMHDPASIHADAKTVADSIIESWRDAPMPGESALAARCVIFTAHCDGDVRAAYLPEPGDYVIAADGGYLLAKSAGMRCDELIGDFDSMDEPAAALPIARHPREKDDTDTMLCVRRALELGYGEILLIGGVGGRVDHTLANVQTLIFAVNRGAKAAMRDGNVYLAAVKNGALSVPRGRGKLSVFSLSDASIGVTLEGVRYPLRGATLTSDYPIGTSNEFTGDFAQISVKSGTLLVVAGGQ